MSQQAPTQENFKMKLGTLRSEIELTLHTYHAVRVWRGGQPTRTPGYTVPSMSIFFSITNLLKLSSARDNPYADWWILQLEEKMDAAEIEMREYDSALEKLISNASVQLSVSDNLNQQPYTTPIFCASHLGFKGVYLLEAYDQLARKVLLANHIARLSRSDMEGYLDKGAHMLRSVFHLALQYKNTGVTRDDMAAKNARYAAAVERMGLPPQDILEGTRRSEYAPPINKNKEEDTDEDNADTIESWPETEKTSNEDSAAINKTNE